MFLCSLLGRVSFLNGVLSSSFRSTRNSTFWKATIILLSNIASWTNVFRFVALTFSPMCGDLPLTVAIGLQSMDLIDGVNQVQGDITNVRTAEVVKTILL
ncbi:hypothetical protein C4D60_Mb10t27440 [Musa balbisiana]|uniref:Uncharacterized protein n=1 Tax=Musa balbisiana TaxID=52838 RepID=A0A4S8J0A8_MUSBA|nr:hypothetical protein C4D60_Mb10t27440 [Musa balbisiana]